MVVITATNVVTVSNDQGEPVTQEQVGTVVVTATGEGEQEQSKSIPKSMLYRADASVTATDPDATAPSDALVIVTRTMSDTQTAANGEESVVIAVSQAGQDIRLSAKTSDNH